MSTHFVRRGGRIYLNFNEQVKQDTLCQDGTNNCLGGGKVNTTYVLEPIAPVDVDTGTTGGVKPLPYSDPNIEFDYGTATCAQLEAVINYIAGPAQSMMTSQQAMDYYYTRNNEAKAAWKSKSCNTAASGGNNNNNTPDTTTSPADTGTDTNTTNTSTDTNTGAPTATSTGIEKVVQNIGSVLGIPPAPGAGSGSGSGSNGKPAEKKKTNWLLWILCIGTIAVAAWQTKNSKMPIGS